MCACSVDIGTGNLCSAKQDANGEIKLKYIRDVFLDLANEPQTKSMLRLSKTDFIEDGDKIYVIGGPANTLANIFQKSVRRPMSSGILSPGEKQAERVMMVLLEAILGKSQSPTPEICFYSVPANPIDANLDIVYHKAMFSKLISQLNYVPIAMNEGAAVSYANAAPENFSSLSISFGAGQVNICLMYQTVSGMEFSLARSGDFIDNSAAISTGSTPSRIQATKEKGIDLLDPSVGDPKTIREREAITIYYKSLILYTLENIKKEFNKRQGSIDLPCAIPIILSGGTSLPVHFRELFEEGFNTMKDSMPFTVSQIRMATDPLGAVAQGLLVAALNHADSNK